MIRGAQMAKPGAGGPHATSFLSGVTACEAADARASDSGRLWGGGKMRTTAKLISALPLSANDRAGSRMPAGLLR